MPTDDLTPILKIAKDISFSGKGISLVEALKRSNYSELRKSLSEENLTSALKANPPFVQEWLVYSENKRTTGGYYLSNRVVGNLHSKVEKYSFENDEEAVAKFIILELDYWFDQKLEK